MKGHTWIYAQSRWRHDLEAQPYPRISSPVILTAPSPQGVSDPPTLPGFTSPWFLLLLHQLPNPFSPPLPPGSLHPKYFLAGKTPTKHQFFSKVKFLSNQRSQFSSSHILQLSFMSLPSCSSEQPLLVVFYFGGARLAATFSISPQNCSHLISHVNLLTVCRSSKQQHFCVAHEHFRTSVGHCWGSCI